MNNCENCFWHRMSLSTPHIWKCKLMPDKRFNHAKLHGWFCKKFYAIDRTEEVNEDDE